MLKDKLFAKLFYDHAKALMGSLKHSTGSSAELSRRPAVPRSATVRAFRSKHFFDKDYQLTERSWLAGMKSFLKQTGCWRPSTAADSLSLITGAPTGEECLGEFGFGK